ncbi:hypothetical protein KSP39_PZI008048 [Platanthera zijinensis]|uniref:Ribosomal protein L19 n=1 Tax=Platanthera zijinensis TaxID=2320716 RepID=A0AAP0BN47_9ASPA
MHLRAPPAISFAPRRSSSVFVRLHKRSAPCACLPPQQATCTQHSHHSVPSSQSQGPSASDFSMSSRRQAAHTKTAPKRYRFRLVPLQLDKVSLGCSSSIVDRKEVAMAANTLSHTHSLLYFSARPLTKKSASPIFSSLPRASLASRRAPLPTFSLEAFAIESPSPLINRRSRDIAALAANSTPAEGEAEAAALAGQSEEVAEYSEDPVAVSAEKPPRKPRIKLGDIMGILNKRAVEASEKQRPVPELRTGDIVEIKLEVPENRKRLSVYKGIIMSRQNAGIHTTIRIRRIIAGIGVEIVFPMATLTFYNLLLELNPYSKSVLSLAQKLISSVGAAVRNRPRAAVLCGNGLTGCPVDPPEDL